MIMDRYQNHDTNNNNNNLLGGEASIPEEDAPVLEVRSRERSLKFPFPSFPSTSATTPRGKTLECSHNTVETVTSSLASFQLTTGDDDDDDDGDESDEIAEVSEESLHEKTTLATTPVNDPPSRRTMCRQEDSLLTDPNDIEIDPFKSSETISMANFLGDEEDDSIGGNDPMAMWSMQAQRHLTLTFDHIEEDDEVAQEEEEEDEDPRRQFLMRREESLHQESGNLDAGAGWEDGF